MDDDPTLDEIFEARIARECAKACRSQPRETEAGA